MLKPINRKIGLVLIGFALFYLILSFRLPEYPYAAIDADFVPKSLGFLLLLLSVLLFFFQEGGDGRRKEKAEDTGRRSKDIAYCLRVYIGLYLLF